MNSGSTGPFKARSKETSGRELEEASELLRSRNVLDPRLFLVFVCITPLLLPSLLPYDGGSGVIPILVTNSHTPFSRILVSAATSSLG